MRSNLKKYLVIAITFLLASCSQAERDLNEAIALSRDGLALLQQSENPDLTEADRVKLAAEGLAKAEAAKESYQALIAADPQRGLYHNNYAWLQMKLGDLAGAEKSFEEAGKYRDSIQPDGVLETNLEALRQLREDQAHRLAGKTP